MTAKTYSTRVKQLDDVAGSHPYTHSNMPVNIAIQYDDDFKMFKAIVGDHDFVFTNVNLGKLVDDVKATLGHLYTPTKRK